MNRRNAIGILGMMVFTLGLACAQDNAPQSESPAPPQPVPAYGQDNNASAPISENPPLSGLDLPSLQEHAAPLSYLQPGATFSETATTNIGNTVGGNDFGSITRGLGTLELRRLWSNYDLALDYIGGAAYYNQNNLGWRQLQDLAIAQKIEWKRGSLSLRDSFSYLPEGNFGAAYGSLGSVGASAIGNIPGGLWGGSMLGALGLAPRLLNVSLGEFTQNLSPKSAITATGGYSFTHFYGNDVSGTAFIGSSQVTAQVGYDRILNAHTQIAAAYAYQGFDFTVVGTAFHSHVIQGMYGHRITGRMDLLLGAGPQFTDIGTACNVFDAPPLGSNPHCTLGPGGVALGTIPTTKIGVAAQARLRYRLSRSTLDLRYERFETSGGGLFAGAQSDVVRLDVEHPLSRVWSLSLNAGFSRNDRLQQLTLQQLGTCNGAGQSSQTACPANNATTYDVGYAGAALHRYFGRNFHGFVSYQFNELSFDHSYCSSGAQCNRISNRQIVTFGLDWTPRPIRID